MSPIYARSTDNILEGAVITSSTFAPLATYDLPTLTHMNPAHRVLFDGDSGSVIFTLGAAALGDVLCIPQHNFSGGSPSPLTLTNNNGFSASIPIPDLQVDGFPPTLAVDLTGLASAATRTASVWTLVVANGVDLVLGGAVAIYSPLRTFLGVSANTEGSFVGEFTETETPRNVRATNEYGTPYVQEYGTVNRAVAWSLILDDRAALREIRDWFRANAGSARPSLLSPYPDEPEDFSPYFGTWQDTLTVETIDRHHTSVKNVFSEWPKGQVIP